MKSVKMISIATEMKTLQMPIWFCARDHTDTW